MVSATGKDVPFGWYTFDLNAELPNGWKEDILEIARSTSRSRTLVPTSVTSREALSVTGVPVRTVGGRLVAERLPWLAELYRTRFRDLAQSLTEEAVSTASDERHGINLNVQIGSGNRYECHVDSNPIEGLLYVTSHPAGSGGELVVSNAGDVVGQHEVDQNAAHVYPVSGHLIFFDARHHTHYVKELADPNGIRVVAAMNFYTPTSTEADRPGDLNHHLFGTD